MPTRAEQQLKERFRIIDEAAEKLTKNLPTLQSEIYKEILPLLERFDTTGGKIEYNKTAIDLINQLEQSLKRAINRTDYKDRVLDYLTDFQKVKDQNIKIQSSLNKINVRSSALNSIQKESIKTALNNLTGSGLDTNFIQPVKKVLFQHAVGGASIADTELALRQVIKGTPEKFGKLERYLTQMSRDSVHQFDGEIQARIANEFDLNCLSFEGSLIRDSRPACVRAVEVFNGVLRIDELQEQIDWAYENSNGMIPNTTPANFFMNRFGYNCRHTVTAIRCLD